MTLYDEPKGKRKVVQTPIGPVECPGIENLPGGEKVKLGIRAESINFTEATNAGRNNCFAGTVQNTIFLGEYIDCEVNINKHVFKVTLSPELEVSAGSRVGV
ncbi:MAG: TOBE domain-containing protein [Candidatus Zixiibacteriota bacterium]